MNSISTINIPPSMVITVAVVAVVAVVAEVVALIVFYIWSCNIVSGSSLEASVIETFPTFSYAEVKEHKIGKGTLECAVCLNEFEYDETMRLIPKCDHVFHPECIDPWLEAYNTCPVCRADLTPQPDDGSYHLPETDQQDQKNNTKASGNDDVTIQIPDDQTRQGSKEGKPRVNRNWSFNIEYGRFRAHSTGNSIEQAGLVNPGENVDRFTLRLPGGIRQEMMNRALLNRTKSTAMGLPSDEGSRRGNKSGGIIDGGNRGGRSFSRIDRSKRVAKSLFSKALPFFSRALSIRSPRVMADNGEGSTSKSMESTVKMPSFKCLEPRSADETVVVHSDSARPPV